jgi:hypothetical protein
MGGFVRHLGTTPLSFYRIGYLRLDGPVLRTIGASGIRT